MMEHVYVYLRSWSCSYMQLYLWVYLYLYMFYHAVLWYVVIYSSGAMLTALFTVVWQCTIQHCFLLHIALHHHILYHTHVVIDCHACTNTAQVGWRRKRDRSVWRLHSVDSDVLCHAEMKSYATLWYISLPVAVSHNTFMMECITVRCTLCCGMSYCGMELCYVWARRFPG